MAYYAYKEVVYEPEYMQAKKEFIDNAYQGNPELFDEVLSYDGDCWLVVRIMIENFRKEKTK
jgi:hypothetical protein